MRSRTSRDPFAETLTMMTYNEALATAWNLLRSRYCHRQMNRNKVRVMWWPPDNIFPQRTDFVRTARAAMPYRFPLAKHVLGAVRRLDACTLPWAPTFAAINAADNAMFTEGDKYNIDMQVRRNVLVDVLHTVPPDIRPAQIEELMRVRFQERRDDAPARYLMTPKAGQHTYAEFIHAGWGDQQLIEHGYMY
jgi:hypothetical protein